MESWAHVTCPHCFQGFDLPAPPPTECPSTLDYDCEVCCRPMMIDVDYPDPEDAPVAEARSLDD